MTRTLLKNLLGFFARQILSKYQPEVIGITGSVGKSGTKEAVYAVLAPYFSVRKSEGNYNTEIGAPLTIIGARGGGGSTASWLQVFLKAVRLILIRDQNYPAILVLEMAADKPGDIEYLVNLTKPKIGVLTIIGTSHLENFKTIDRIAAEKGKLISKLGKDGYAILNFDDDRVLGLRGRARNKVITYGFKDGADVQGLDVSLMSKLYEWKEDNFEIGGTATKIMHQGNVVPLFLVNVLGKTHIYAALAATSVGIAKGLNLIQITDALKSYSFLPGRLKLVPGVKKTYLIDDSYNASPISIRAALQLLREINLGEEARRFAVLGDMLELGSESEEAHIKVGELLAELGIDYLVTVGQLATNFAKGARSRGMSDDRLYHFALTEQAGRFIQDRIKTGDLILIKASRGMRFEKITRELMANPSQADKLLVK